MASFAGDGPELLVFAHTDTEPVHPGWRTDPFELQVDGSRATGLGTADDKGGVVAALAAVRQWQERGRIGWRPRVLFAAGKQGGSLGTLPGVQAATGVGAALYSHPAESGAGLTQLKVASRGIVTCRVRVAGLSAPPVEERTPVSADPRAGHNAAARAARLAMAAQAWNDESRVWTVTALRSGGAPYEVPASAELDLACWFSEGTVDEVVASVRARVAGGRDWERSHPPLVEAVGLRANPADCATDAFSQSVAEIVAARIGRRPDEYSWHSASDIRFPMRVLGVPAVGLGARGGGFYGPGEWVDLDSLTVSADVLADVLCAGPP
jgi:acetylornithine deacetylase